MIFIMPQKLNGESSKGVSKTEHGGKRKCANDPVSQHHALGLLLQTFSLTNILGICTFLLSKKKI